MQIGAFLSAGVGESCYRYALRVLSALKRIHLIVSALSSSRVKFSIDFHKIMRPGHSDSVLIFCCEASVECVIALCASEHREFAKR